MRALRFAGLVALALAAAGCPRKPEAGSATGPTPAAAPTPTFKSGYLRPPSHDRVIIFVNGVFGDSLSTWTNEETGAYWPQLVADDPDFSAADVYVHSFESPKLHQAQEILELAGRLKNYLDAQNVITGHREVVFVCHSMGGLIVRAYMLSARIPPEKIGFLAFLGTPTAGANVAEFASAISPNPQLANMRPLDDDTYVKTLREQWLRSSDDPALDYPRKVSSFCSYEKLDTWGIKVVEENSAITLCNRGTTAVLADHLGIVKPAGRDGEAYVALLAAYKNQFSPVAMQIRSALAEVRPATLTTAARSFRVADLASAKIALRQAKATVQPVTVACGRTSEGELSVAADLADGESVAEVHPEIVNGSNLGASSAVVVRFDGRTALVRYRIEGACPGNGSADVAVNFVTSSRRAFPPAARDFVRPELLTIPPGAATHVPDAVVHVVPSPTPRVARPFRGGTEIRVRTPSR